MFGLETASWAPAAAALIFGIAIGWLIWGGRRQEIEPQRRDPGSVIAKGNGNNGDPCPDGLKLGAIESEIRAARELLEESDNEAASFSEELSGLDESIKRANGRLKLILRAVRRATPDR